MIVQEREITAKSLLALAQTLTTDDLQWLVQQLNRLMPEPVEEPLPEQATVDEAVDLYLAERCSLGRAAELAGVTRWHIRDALREQGLSIPIHGDMSSEEMDIFAEELEQEGYL